MNHLNFSANLKLLRLIREYYFQLYLLSCGIKEAFSWKCNRIVSLFKTFMRSEAEICKLIESNSVWKPWELLPIDGDVYMIVRIVGIEVLYSGSDASNLSLRIGSFDAGQWWFFFLLLLVLVEHSKTYSDRRNVLGDNLREMDGKDQLLTTFGGGTLRLDAFSCQCRG